MSDLDQYSRYFSVGMKVGVGIPLANADVFRDWAVIHELDEDFVSLQLSRDQLPVNVSLHVGQILELRGGTEGNGYSCRAIIVFESAEREIMLRLIGEIVSDELREYYRIDAFLPIKYYISQEQHPEILQEEWEARREQRMADNLARKQKRWDSTFVAGKGELPRERFHDAEDDDSDEAWDTIIPLAANISGGGIRMVTHQGFESGEYVLLEILVPSPRRIIDAVAQIIFANSSQTGDDNHLHYNTGMQFVFIDERDRDAIVNHISNVQLKRIRQLREKYVFRDEEGEAAKAAGRGFDWLRFMRQAVVSIVFLAIIYSIYVYFRNYTANKPKNEIEEIFEGGIRRYLEKQK